MSSKRRVLACIGLLAVAIAIGVAATGSATAAAADAPNLTVSVDNRSVETGAPLVVGPDPQVGIEAAQPGDGSLRTVLVEVDGETVHRFTDPGATLSVTRPLPLAAGNNSVRVIVENGNGTVTADRFRVYLETVPPSFSLSEPVRTAARPYDFPSVTVTEATVTLEGRFTDRSGVREGRVVFDRPGEGSVAVASPETRFALPVFLRYGTNRFTVSTTDGRGNQYFDSFTVRLRDPDRPTLEIDPLPRLVNEGTVLVRGTARDNVWVENVTMRVAYVGRTPYQARNATYEPVGDRPYRPHPRRLNASFEQEVTLLTGLNYVAVTATDHRGQRRTRDYWVEYAPDRQAAPRISLDRDRTTLPSNRTLALTALVTDQNRDLARVSLLATDTGGDADGGNVTDVAVIRPETNGSYLLRENVTVAPGTSRVRLRATDATGNTTESSFLVDTGRDDGERLPATTASAGDPATGTSGDGTATATARTATGTGESATTGSGDGTEETGESSGSGGSDGLLAGVPLAGAVGGAVVLALGGALVAYRRLTRV